MHSEIFEPIKCFMLEEIGKIKRYLRHSHAFHANNVVCTAPYRYMNGMTFLDIIDHPVKTYIGVQNVDVPFDDPRWVKKCDCGHVFTMDDVSVIHVESLYKRSDTGEITTLRDAPVGAMWDQWWMHEFKRFCGLDGLSFVVKCPPDGREWCIDSVANNCTKPTDFVHKCWVRHGVPPNLTVDKDGETCAAGAGSILLPKWHGFLRNGYLVS